MRSREKSTLRSRFLPLAATAALLAGAAGEAHALTDSAIRCRDGAARFARSAMVRALTVRVNCVRRTLFGEFDPTIDCLAEPEELGGPGTGDLWADRRLAKLAILRERAGEVLASRCLSKDVLANTLPSDVLLDDTCTPASDDWADVGRCIYDRGMEAAKIMMDGLNLQGPGPLSEPALACMDAVHYQVRRSLGVMTRFRAMCFRQDDTVFDGGGIYECGATIMPSGTVQTTLLLKSDQRLGEAYPRLDETILEYCDLPLEDVGYDLITPDVTGGRFEGRITLYDLQDRLNDLLQEAAHHVSFGDTGSEGMFDAAQAGGFCGDGTLDADEACDDGNNLSCDGCDRDCTLPACGNGAVCDAEECDDGNLVDGDGCTSACISELCGNSVVNLGFDEDCDTGGFSVTCDDDCTIAECGDQLVNAVAGETCDEGTGLPLNQAQNTATCDSDCSAPACPDGHFNPLNTAAPAPGTGEECDDGGFSMACDNDCTLASCGDGDVNPVRSEACDDGNFVDTDDCPSSSTVPGSFCTAAAFCGDGFTCAGGGCSSVEACDDGDGTPGSSESATCDDDCTTVVCGDSNLNPSAGEQCDQGGSNANTRRCTLGCQNARCGDGLVCSHGTCTTGPGGAPEQCDDADGDNFDMCKNNCGTATCGDGVVCLDPSCTTGPGGTPEQCDSSGVNTASCDANCTAAFCGDSTFNAAAGEACDSGGVNTAGCDSDCTAPLCGDSLTNVPAGEACDTGGVNTAGCDSDCSLPLCGDSLTNVPAGETCDSGGVNTAGCDSDCTAPACGDSLTNVPAGEACDSGGVNTAGCDSNCTLPVCGDSLTNIPAGEQCDNGGSNSNTRPCTATCQTATCGDGLVCSHPSCTSGGGGPEACDDGVNNGAGSGFCDATCTGITP